MTYKLLNDINEYLYILDTYEYKNNYSSKTEGLKYLESLKDYQLINTLYNLKKIYELDINSNESKQIDAFILEIGRNCWKFYDIINADILMNEFNTLFLDSYGQPVEPETVYNLLNGGFKLNEIIIINF